MNMIRKMWVAAVLLTFCHSVNAQENYLQIKPTQIGFDISKKRLELEMVNEETFLCLGFKVFLPEGVSFTSSAGSGLNGTRFPFDSEYNDDLGIDIPVYKHSIQYQEQSDGSMKFAISANDLSEIKGNNGRLIYLNIQFDAGLQPGIYPVKVTNVEFTQFIEEQDKMVTVYGPDVSTSFIVAGEPTIGSKVDLSCLTDFVSSDVCDVTSAWLAGLTDVTEVDLTGISVGGKSISAGNPNALFYVKEGATFAVTQSNGQSNTIEGTTCKRLVLTDGYPFNASKAFVASEASYARSVSASGWYSLCLPFSADASAGVEVERYGSFNESTSELVFNSGDVDAYKPCIFNAPTTGEVAFTATNAEVTVTPAVAEDGMMVGAFSKVEGSALTGCYALKADGTGFGTCGSNTYVPPFRAYVKTSATGANVLKLVHGGDVTGIGEVVESDNLLISVQDGGCTVKAVGKAAKVCVHSLDGRLVKKIILAANAGETIALSAGIYMINENKVVVK